MKKIIIGFAALFSLLTSNCLAASSSPKNDVSIPCYNSGLNFGLASYTTQTHDDTRATENPSTDENSYDDQIDYR